MKAFEMCQVKDFCFSYDSLTSHVACERLWVLRMTDPDFYVELTTGTAAKKVPESEEEESEDTDVELDDLEDDSNLLCDVVVARVLDRTRTSSLLLSNSTGGL